MHELSIAMSIVELAEEEGRAPLRSGECRASELGASSGVVKEALLSRYEMAVKALRCRVRACWWKTFSAVIFCPGCQAQRPLSSLQLFCCSECGYSLLRDCAGEKTRSRCSGDTRMELCVARRKDIVLNESKRLVRKPPAHSFAPVFFDKLAEIVGMDDVGFRFRSGERSRLQPASIDPFLYFVGAGMQCARK